MILFDGYDFASTKEALLRPRVAHLRQQGLQPFIAAILFEEDAGSRLYTRLKREAAERVGIGYQVHSFSMTDPLESVAEQIKKLTQEPRVTGIIIQKPWRAWWADVTGKPIDDFSAWWHQLVSSLDLAKDVDGLHPQTLAAIQAGTWHDQGLVLPATAKAVLDILGTANMRLTEIGLPTVSPEVPITILGRSDILGQPLYYELSNQGYKVEMIGSKELKQKIEQGICLRDRGVVISATGRMKLITGDLLAPGAVVIDVGEPKPDIDFETVSKVASFLTPVPGGVGPVTVVSLLENSVELLEK